MHLFPKVTHVVTINKLVCKHCHLLYYISQPGEGSEASNRSPRNTELHDTEAMFLWCMTMQSAVLWYVALFDHSQTHTLLCAACTHIHTPVVTQVSLP